MSALPVLALFDIDGTLLRGAAGSHMQALREALHEVYGVTPAQRPTLDPAGRTDLEIARVLLLEQGVSGERIAAGFDDLREACCRRYAELCPADLSDTVAPGMADLVDHLDARRDVRLSLVTGNLEPVARLKLRRAGIGHLFGADQGAFGSDAEDRTDLPPIARRRAGSGGRSHPRERTVLIGDTARDIACARADGLRCLAVSWRRHDPPDLSQADGVAGDAGRLLELIETLV